MQEQNAAIVLVIPEPNETWYFSFTEILDHSCTGDSNKDATKLKLYCYSTGDSNKDAKRVHATKLKKSVHHSCACRSPYIP